MASREADLLTKTILDAGDLIRGIDGEVSVNISLEDLATSLRGSLEAAGFVTTTDSPANFSQIRTLKTKTADYTMDLTDGVILVNTASSAITITLPTALSAYNSTKFYGQQFTVKKITTDANAVTVTPPGSELLDGGTVTLAGGTRDSTTFISDGTKWWVV